MQQGTRAMWMDPEPSTATSIEGTLFSSRPRSGHVVIEPRLCCIALGHVVAAMVLRCWVWHQFGLGK
jgi:hypothetical protein